MHPNWPPANHTRDIIDISSPEKYGLHGIITGTLGPISTENELGI